MSDNKRLRSSSGEASGPDLESKLLNAIGALSLKMDNLIDSLRKDYDN